MSTSPLDESKNRKTNCRVSSFFSTALEKPIVYSGSVCGQAHERLGLNFVYCQTWLVAASTRGYWNIKAFTRCSVSGHVVFSEGVMASALDVETCMKRFSPQTIPEYLQRFGLEGWVAQVYSFTLLSVNECVPMFEWWGVFLRNRLLFELVDAEPTKALISTLM